LLITPRALTATTQDYENAGSGEELEDPLLELLRGGASLGQDEFLEALRKQRSSEVVG
jgi:hypothetical protein